MTESVCGVVFANQRAASRGRAADASRSVVQPGSGRVDRICCLPYGYDVEEFQPAEECAIPIGGGMDLVAVVATLVDDTAVVDTVAGVATRE